MSPISRPRILFFAALAASLIANFFAFGYVFKSHRDAPAMTLLAEGAFSAYSDEIRVEFRRILRENRPRTVVALRNLREARRRLSSLANVSQIDEAEVRRAMQDVRTATDALQRLMQEFLLQALKARERPQNSSGEVEWPHRS